MTAPRATPPPCHYLALREGVDQDRLLAYWTDGTLAQMVWSDAKGEYEWEAVRGPDYLAIRAEIEHPERTLPPVQAD